ncbi:response regulator [Candidatus Sumerlaeota bacterium]|nr:response regulator [Candidatus Sumerlaeota bacterium]
MSFSAKHNDARDDGLFQILVMESDAAELERLERLLTRFGHRVLPAADYNEAMVHLKITKPDIAFLEFLPSRAAHTEMLAALHNRFPDTLVVLLSIQSGSETTFPVYRMHIFDVLYKPVRASDLQFKVERCYQRLRIIHEKEMALKALREQNQKLIESQERFWLAQQFSHLGVWDWDLVTGRATRAEQAYKIPGSQTFFDSDNINDFYSMVHPEDQARVRRAQEDCIHHGKDYNTEFRIQDPGGSVRWLSERGNVIRDQNGRAIRMVGVVLDITKRKHAEAEQLRMVERIQETQRLEGLGVLAGGIAHEFNNLMMGILGNTSLLMESSPPESIMRKLNSIERSANRAAELTNQILAYAGKGQYFLERLNLSGLVRDIKQLLLISLHKHHEMIFQLQDDLPCIEGDMKQIQQLVVNLATNAAEALTGRENGKISVETGVRTLPRANFSMRENLEHVTPGEYVYIRVEDNGIGMDDETIEHCFEPFYTTRFMGRGLGLAAVEGILRSHHGVIDMRSVQDHGTVVTAYFPREGLLQEKTEAPEIPQAKPQEQDQTVVLFVDDDEMILEIAQSYLKENGFEVRLADNGRKAVDLAATSPGDIDIVLLDMTLPDISGQEVFEQIRKVNSAVPVILTSGYTQESVLGATEHLKPAGFLQKPYRPNDLLSIIERILKK